MRKQRKSRNHFIATAESSREKLGSNQKNYWDEDKPKAR